MLLLAFLTVVGEGTIWKECSALVLLKACTPRYARWSMTYSNHFEMIWSLSSNVDRALKSSYSMGEISFLLKLSLSKIDNNYW